MLIDSKEKLVELFYNYKKYLIKKSDLDDKRNKIVMLPNGIAFDLTEMYVDNTNKLGDKPKPPRLVAKNPICQIFGLPIVGVIRASGSENTNLDGPICPACHGSDIEYLGDHWICLECLWQTTVSEFKPEQPKDVNPNENICCEYGDDD